MADESLAERVAALEATVATLQHAFRMAVPSDKWPVEMRAAVLTLGQVPLHNYLPPYSPVGIMPDTSPLGSVDRNPKPAFPSYDE
jgi:hypothetical protein